MNFVGKLKNLNTRLKKACQALLLPDKYYSYEKQTYGFHNLSFSQQGEDMVLSILFAEKSKGFYVDVGAYHPQKYSNTYYFYQKGWRGINIDARPGSMNLFKEIRPNDINLELPISDKNQILTYYEFDDSAVNGFYTFYENQEHMRKYKITTKKELQTYRLSDILNEYLPVGQAIDFLSVDVEGLDYQVLTSNDWKKYKPKVIVAEDLSLSSIEKAGESKIVDFLHDQGYKLYSKLIHSIIFIENS